MLEASLITTFTDRLTRADVDYMITGSVATIVYGEPRLTHDVDLVLSLNASQLKPFLRQFPLEEFYAPPEETVRLEIQRASRAHFNLIHHASGFKADCYPIGNDALHAWGMAHRRKIALEGSQAIWLAPPEYVIIRKIEYYREGESTKHLDDIRRMLPQLDDLNTTWLEAQLQQRGLIDTWRDIVDTSHS